jgi:tetratricopeptide (TPR) repeat protein
MVKRNVLMNDEDQRLPWSMRFFRTIDLIVFHVQAWFFTRRFGLLLQGVPSLLLAAGLVVLAAEHRRGPDRRLITRYDQAVDLALRSNDPVSAKVYVRKLILLDEPGPQTRYALARLAEYEGDTERAARIMQDLAPYPGSGYPAAHFWMGMKLLESQPADEAVAARDRAIHHFEQSLRTPDARDQAHERLAELYLARNDSTRAVRHLEEVVFARPEFNLPLAEIYARGQDKVRLQRALRQAREYFQSRVLANPEDVKARISWAKVSILDRELDEAKRILEEGLAASDDVLLRQALADTYLAMVDQRGISDERLLPQLLDLLTEALRVAPDHPEVVNRLAMFLRYSGTPGDLMRERLMDRLATGQTPATMHLLVGSLYVAEARWDDAQRHLEQAYRLDSRLPALLNQLAWALASGKSPDLERALRLAEAAVELSPDEPAVRATRGRILARLQQWQEALTDLEAVLKSGVEQSEIHATLGEVYTALGDAGMAKRHQALAERHAKKPASFVP